MSEATDPGIDPARERYVLHRRFDRLGRLVGDDAMQRLLGSHAMVIGLGGVGSWAAEMLVRSGVGRVDLVDFDQVCITNVNRQVHALVGTIGQFKATALAERLAKINPQARIEGIIGFYDRERGGALLDRGAPYVIDAIDSITHKAHLLHACLARGIRVVCATGSGGRLDPTQVRTGDLAATRGDPLARAVRKILRLKYGFRKKLDFGIPAVHTLEPAREPLDLGYDRGKGFGCVCPQGLDRPFSCEARRRIYGTAGFVTAAMGQAAAALVVRAIAGDYAWPAPQERRAIPVDVGLDEEPGCEHEHTSACEHTAAAVAGHGPTMSDERG